MYIYVHINAGELTHTVPSLLWLWVIVAALVNKLLPLLKMKTKAGHLHLQHATFISGDEILDVDERVRAAIPFHKIKSFLDQITEIFFFLLSVSDSITSVLSLVPEDVANWQELAVVRD